jgi:hypothetical protein
MNNHRLFILLSPWIGGYSAPQSAWFLFLLYGDLCVNLQCNTVAKRLFSKGFWIGTRHPGGVFLRLETPNPE